MLVMDRRLLILTEGVRDPLAAKTGISVIRYRPEGVVAVLDSAQAGRTAEEVFGVGGELPVVGSLDDPPAADADTLLIGVAPPGGKLPGPMRRIVLDAIERGMNVESGLHEFLSEDAELRDAAARSGAILKDVRKNDERDVATRQGIDPQCLRIQTIGNDCSVGKMIAAIEVSRALRRGEHDGKFVATGQTGILIEGEGCPIDTVVGDFINGAAERLVLANQHHPILLIEGQGSLIHPRYSAVTLGLLHGCMPDGLILCYEVGRERVFGMDHVPLAPLERVIDLYERAANVMHPCRVIGVAMNSRRCSDAEAEAERERVRERLGLPVCDVLRHGPGELADAVLQYGKVIGKLS